MEVGNPELSPRYFRISGNTPNPGFQELNECLGHNMHQTSDLLTNRALISGAAFRI
jgi:hypothetical protein